MNKQRVFSGLQPSGSPHIGNYLGAIKNWVKLQDDYEAMYCVVDLHAITVPQNPEVLRKKTIEAAKMYLAAGIDPERSTIFVQSHVSEHSELAWILNTITRNSDLTKMTQFKDKSGVDFDEYEKGVSFMKETDITKSEQEIYKKFKALDRNDANYDYLLKILIRDTRRSSFEVAQYFFKQMKEKFNSVGVGLYDYPVLQVADILLYDTDIVPVGKDQEQHIELTRKIANRFNKQFGDIFRVPKSYIVEKGSNIMGLDDASKKMSKSAQSEYNYIALDDDPKKARKKIMKAVTDSGSEIMYSDEKPAIKNLLNMYSLLSGKTTQEIEEMYQGKGYGDFKRGLADVVEEFLRMFQERYSTISDEEVRAVLERGAVTAKKIAEEKMKEVKEKVGFIV